MSIKDTSKIHAIIDTKTLYFSDIFTDGTKVQWVKWLPFTKSTALAPDNNCGSHHSEVR